MPQVESGLLLQDSLDPIQAFLEGFYSRSVGEANEVVARAVEEVPSFSRI